MHKTYYISKSNIQTIQSYGIADLDNRQSDIITAFKDRLGKSTCKTLITYRGTKDNILRDTYLKDWQDANKLLLYQRIFYFGEKARSYYDIPEDKSKKTKELGHIHKTENSVYPFLFDQINKILNTNYSNRSIKCVITNFIHNNKDFCDYFRNTKNKSTFTYNCTKANTNLSLSIRDYLLYILHTFGRESTKRFSYFVSTTKKRLVAEHFAMNRQSDGDDPIVLKYLVPQPAYKYGFDQNTISYLNSQQNKIPFPLTEEPFYLSQDEFSIKGALFPHFIIGIMELTTKNFIINPHLFNHTTPQKLDYALNHGFDIDQSNFESELTKTNFKKFATLSNGVFEDYFITN